jgi:hypothetical protein
LPSKPSFTRVVSAAVDDLAEHGFDSAERVARWVQAIRDAAKSSLVPESVMDDQIRRSFGTMYARLVDRAQLLKWHPGAPRFTLEKVRPQLRAELDRRMMASRELIKLNRARAVEETIQRFAGWATSVPPGGSDASDKTEARQTVRKALAQMPFVDRRLATDQGHKFVANLNNILATDGGALALIWNSNWRQPGYQYRPDHKERDGNIYVMRDNWALERGLMKLAGRKYYDEITSVGEEISCRCFATYVYTLRRLPDDMLTDKGRAELDRVAA